jgi:hypothetical protein
MKRQYVQNAGSDWRTMTIISMVAGNIFAVNAILPPELLLQIGIHPA